MNEPYLTCELVSLNEQVSAFDFPKDFSCGTSLFDNFVNKGGLKKALKSENLHATGLVVDGNFGGYLTVTLSILDRPRVLTFLKQQTNQPPQIPVVKILMIAVDERFQKRGMGMMLMAEAFNRAFKIHQTVPVKGIYLDAGPGTVPFYKMFGFQALDKATEEGITPMFMAMTDVIDALNEAALGDGG